MSDAFYRDFAQPRTECHSRRFITYVHMYENCPFRFEVDLINPGERENRLDFSSDVNAKATRQMEQVFEAWIIVAANHDGTTRIFHFQQLFSLALTSVRSVSHSSMALIYMFEERKAWRSVPGALFPADSLACFDRAGGEKTPSYLLLLPPIAVDVNTKYRTINSTEYSITRQRAIATDI